MPDLNDLQSCLSSGAHDQAEAVCASISAAHHAEELAPVAIKLLLIRAASSPESTRPSVVREGLAELRARYGELQLVQNAAAVGDLYFLGGYRQEGLEFLRSAYRNTPEVTALAHRIGLGELAHALASTTVDTPSLMARWRRALAHLTVAVNDHKYWRRWTTYRSKIYDIALTSEAIQVAQQHVYDQIRHLMSAAAERADHSGQTRNATALRDLVLELEIDRASSDVMAYAWNCAEQTLTEAGSPLPFGLLWYRTLESPGAALNTLKELIGHTLDIPLADASGRPEFSAPTVGVALRQWYSRLAQARYSLQTGQAQAARNALSRICQNDSGCRINPSPTWSVAAASPSICDPRCAQFAICNPGYAGFSDPARLMEEDAHRLAMRTCLAMAGQHATAQPPRLNEAAQEWLNGRVLAGVLTEVESHNEQVLSQVMGLLDDLWRAPEVAAKLLDRAMAIVPNPALQGRLADRLTDRGISRCNAGQVAECVPDLRWAVRLNRHSARAQESLCVALQRLAIETFRGENVGQAAELAVELQEAAASALGLGMDESIFNPLRQWAFDSASSWKKLASITGDTLSMLEELNRRYQV